MLPRFKKPKRPPVASTLVLPAPVGGLNARDSLALMPPTDAVTLDNWFPGTTSVDLRRGYTNWSTGYPADVESLMTYNGPTISKIFAASGTAFYDATASGAVGAAVVSGLSNARWQHANMGTPGGQFLVTVNGTDYPRSYNGTSWTVYAGVGAQPISTITNVGTLATLTTTAAHQLSAGNSVTVIGATPAAYNGTFSITPVAAIASVPIASITRVGTTATLTTTGPHNLPVGPGNLVTVSGATPAQYNGTYQITVTGATTFTYTMASDPGASAAPVGAYVVEVNKFTYVMASNPGGSASVVGSYVVNSSITGVDPRKLIHVNLYANRLFFVEKDSARIWYLPVNSIGGAALSLDLAPLLTRGGYLMAMATWTIDNSAGVNEYAIFISSEGEIVMYSGTDPAVAANWVKNGRYRTGRPVGRRCYVRVSSDVILLTTDGFIPMSKVILTDRTQQDAISDKITDLVSADLASYFNNFGWEATFSPVGNKLIVNVPQITGSTQYQYVMNTITGAWCRFTAWNANTFEMLGDDLFFGGNLGATPNSAYVARCDYGFSDNGAYIFGEAKTAFQYFGSPGYQKQITMIRPIFKTSGTINAALAMDMDFEDNYPLATPTFTGAAGTLWNTALWNTFPWAQQSSIKRDWQGVTGVGDAGALHMRVVNNMSAMQWQSVEYVYKLGGIL